MIAAALERAVEGWDEPIVQGGAVVAYRRRYSDGLLRDLLRAERAQAEGERKAAGAKRWQRPRTLDEVRGSILRKVEAIRRHQGEEEAEDQRVTWARWRECWGRF